MGRGRSGVVVGRRMGNNRKLGHGRVEAGRRQKGLWTFVEGAPEAATGKRRLSVGQHLQCTCSWELCKLQQSRPYLRVGRHKSVWETLPCPKPRPMFREGAE